MKSGKGVGSIVCKEDSVVGILKLVRKRVSVERTLDSAVWNPILIMIVPSDRVNCLSYGILFLWEGLDLLRTLNRGHFIQRN